MIKNGPILNNVEELKSFKDIFLKQYEKDKNQISFKLKIKEDKLNKEYKEVTREEFVKDIENLAVSLNELDVENKKVGIICKSKYEFPVTYLASSIFSSLVPLDNVLPYDEILKCITRIDLDILFFSDNHIENIEKILKEKEKNKDNINLNNLNKFVFLDNIYTCEEEKNKLNEKFAKLAKSNKNKNVEIYKLTDLLEKGKKIQKENYTILDEIYNKEIDIYKPSIYLFTSATTSESKIVVLCQDNILSNIEDILSVFKIDETHNFLSFLPLHHTFESTVGHLVPITAGAKIHYADSLKKIGENIKEYKITSIIVVPALLEAIYKRIMAGIEKQGKTKMFEIAKLTSNTLLKFGVDQRKKIFSSVLNQLGPDLRLIVNGGAALDPKVQKGLNELGVNVYQGYGLTETSPVISASYDKYNKYGSIGFVMPSQNVKIEDPDSAGVGEILIKGRNLFLGYLKNNQIDKTVFEKDGFFRTGDLGYCDSDNYLYIVGRAKNIIVLKNGKNIFPDESEALLNQIPGVLESLVLGLNEEDATDQKLIAKLVYDETYFKDKNEKEIKDILLENVKKINKTQPTYKYIKDVIITKDSLIKTTTLKIKRYEELKKVKEYLKENK